MQILKGQDLKPGDVVKQLPLCSEATWDTLVVQEVKIKPALMVTFFRPYVYSLTNKPGRVTPLIGVEIFQVFPHGDFRYVLLARQS